VIDVLMGADTERIGRLGHDRLSTYGIGKGLGREQWRSVVRQLVALGLLAVDVEGHGGLRLGEDVRPVLRGERRIALRRDPALERRLRRAEEPPARKAAEPVRLSPDDDALFQALRARRMALSKAQGIPPYVIFHDTTLVAMAREKPTRLLDLARLPGVGEAKLKRYGDAFLEVITEAAAG
jgi:ATP-dependent DNA helicase RecQ